MKVIILGGGLAGLAAAFKLPERATVTILEKDAC
jgi:protoporphyrinogen oxidase